MSHRVLSHRQGRSPDIRRFGRAPACVRAVSHGCAAARKSAALVIVALRGQQLRGHVVWRAASHSCRAGVAAAEARGQPKVPQLHAAARVQEQAARRACRACKGMSKGGSSHVSGMRRDRQPKKRGRAKPRRAPPGLTLRA